MHDIVLSMNKETVEITRQYPFEESIFVDADLYRIVLCNQLDKINTLNAEQLERLQNNQSHQALIWIATKEGAYDMLKALHEKGVSFQSAEALHALTLASKQSGQEAISFLSMAINHIEMDKLSEIVTYLEGNDELDAIVELGSKHREQFDFTMLASYALNAENYDLLKRLVPLYQGEEMSNKFRSAVLDNIDEIDVDFKISQILFPRINLISMYVLLLDDPHNIRKSIDLKLN